MEACVSIHRDHPRVGRLNRWSKVPLSPVKLFQKSNGRLRALHRDVTVAPSYGVPGRAGVRNEQVGPGSCFRSDVHRFKAEASQVFQQGLLIGESRDNHHGLPVLLVNLEHVPTTSMHQAVYPVCVEEP